MLATRPDVIGDILDVLVPSRSIKTPPNSLADASFLEEAMQQRFKESSRAGPPLTEVWKSWGPIGTEALSVVRKDVEQVKLSFSGKAKT